MWCFLPAAFAGASADPAADLDAIYAPRRVALLIGIQDYADPALQGLQFATKDAEDLGRVLSDPSAGGFDDVHVISQPSETTAAAIQQAIAAVTADLITTHMLAPPMDLLARETLMSDAEVRRLQHEAEEEVAEVLQEGFDLAILLRQLVEAAHHELDVA